MKAQRRLFQALFLLSLLFFVESARRNSAVSTLAEAPPVEDVPSEVAGYEHVEEQEAVYADEIVEEIVDDMVDYVVEDINEASVEHASEPEKENVSAVKVALRSIQEMTKSLSLYSTLNGCANGTNPLLAELRSQCKDLINDKGLARYLEFQEFKIVRTPKVCLTAKTNVSAFLRVLGAELVSPNAKLPDFNIDICPDGIEVHAASLVKNVKVCGFDFSSIRLDDVVSSTLQVRSIGIYHDPKYGDGLVLSGKDKKNSANFSFAFGMFDKQTNDYTIHCGDTSVVAVDYSLPTAFASDLLNYMLYPIRKIYPKFEWNFLNWEAIHVQASSGNAIFNPTSVGWIGPSFPSSPTDDPNFALTLSAGAGVIAMVSFSKTNKNPIISAMRSLTSRTFTFSIMVTPYYFSMSAVPPNIYLWNDRIVLKNIRLFGEIYYNSNLGDNKQTFCLGLETFLYLWGEKFYGKALIYFDAAAMKLDLTYAYLGVWKNAYGIPNFDLSKMNGAIGFIATPPFVYMISGGAEFSLGGRANRPAPIQGQYYVKIELTPTKSGGLEFNMDNDNNGAGALGYTSFLLKINSLTIGNIVAAFCDDSRVDKVPSILKNLGFEGPVNASFSKATFTTPYGVTIPAGFTFSGTLNLFGYHAFMSFNVKEGYHFGKTILDPLKLGGLLTIQKSSTDSKNGPNLLIEVKEPPKYLPPSMIISINGYIKCVYFNADVTIHFDTENKLEFTVKAKFAYSFDAVIILKTTSYKSLKDSKFEFEASFATASILEAVLKNILSLKDAILGSIELARKAVTLAQNEMNKAKISCHLETGSELASENDQTIDTDIQVELTVENPLIQSMHARTNQLLSEYQRAVNMYRREDRLDMQKNFYEQYRNQAASNPSSYRFYVKEEIDAIYFEYVKWVYDSTGWRNQNGYPREYEVWNANKRESDRLRRDYDNLMQFYVAIDSIQRLPASDLQEFHINSLYSTSQSYRNSMTGSRWRDELDNVVAGKIRDFPRLKQSQHDQAHNSFFLMDQNNPSGYVVILNKCTELDQLSLTPSSLSAEFQQKVDRDFLKYFTDDFVRRYKSVCKSISDKLSALRVAESAKLNAYTRYDDNPSWKDTFYKRYNELRMDTFFTNPDAQSILKQNFDRMNAKVEAERQYSLQLTKAKNDENQMKLLIQAKRDSDAAAAAALADRLAHSMSDSEIDALVKKSVSTHSFCNNMGSKFAKTFAGSCSLLEQTFKDVLKLKAYRSELRLFVMDDLKTLYFYRLWERVKKEIIPVVERLQQNGLFRYDLITSPLFRSFSGTAKPIWELTNSLEIVDGMVEKCGTEYNSDTSSESKKKALLFALDIRDALWAKMYISDHAKLKKSLVKSADAYFQKYVNTPKPKKRDCSGILVIKCGLDDAGDWLSDTASVVADNARKGYFTLQRDIGEFACRGWNGVISSAQTALSVAKTGFQQTEILASKPLKFLDGIFAATKNSIGIKVGSALNGNMKLVTGIRVVLGKDISLDFDLTIDYSKFSVNDMVSLIWKRIKDRLLQFSGDFAKFF